MKSLTIILTLSICVLGGCAIVQREATTANALGNIFTEENKRKAISTNERTEAKVRAGLKAKSVMTKRQRKQKYCLRCGRRLSSSTGYCPYDGAELKPIEK